MLDAVYFQQNSFDAVDANATVERQKYDLDKLISILGSEFALSEKDGLEVILISCVRNSSTGTIQSLEVTNLRNLKKKLMTCMHQNLEN